MKWWLRQISTVWVEKWVNGRGKTDRLQPEVNANGEDFVTLKFGTQTLPNGTKREIWFWFSLFQSKKCLKEVTSHFHRLVIQVDKIGTNQLFMVEALSSKGRTVSLYLCFVYNRRVEKIHHIFWEFAGRQKMTNCEKGIFFH